MDWRIDGCKRIGVSKPRHHHRVAAAGCSGVAVVEELAVPVAVVAAGPDESLIAFVEKLLSQIEELVMELPEVWVRFGEIFGEAVGRGG